MPELMDAEVIIGVPGLNGGGITSGELTAALAGVAPSNAGYIVKTASGTLTGEQALDALGGPGIARINADGSVSLATGDDLPAHTTTGVAFSMQFNISSGAANTAVPTGEKPEAELCIPVGCTITGFSFVGTPVTGQTSGSATASLWVDSHTNYPPTSGDSITASTPLTISSSVKNASGSRTGWTNALSASHFIRPNILTCTNLASLRITLFLTRSV